MFMMMMMNWRGSSVQCT